MRRGPWQQIHFKVMISTVDIYHHLQKKIRRKNVKPECHPFFIGNHYFHLHTVNKYGCWCQLPSKMIIRDKWTQHLNTPDLGATKRSLCFKFAILILGYFFFLLFYTTASCNYGMKSYVQIFVWYSCPKEFRHPRYCLLSTCVSTAVVVGSLWVHVFCPESNYPSTHKNEALLLLHTHLITDSTRVWQLLEATVHE